MRVADFRSDWHAVWTVSEAEGELDGFTFAGPGFYIESGGVIIVAPWDDVPDPWKQSWPSDQKFLFSVYNQRNPADAFNAILSAPVRKDDRK